MGVDREPDEDGRTDNRRPDEKIFRRLTFHKTLLSKGIKIDQFDL